MLRRSFHSSRTLAQQTWSDFSRRSASLGVQSKAVKKYLFENSKTGPPSLKKRSSRLKYESPEHMDEMFKMAYEYLQLRAQQKYDAQASESDAARKVQLEVEAELHNPEVKYNFQFHDKRENNPAVIDYTQPVYRHLGRKHWESYGQMLLMQRLETLAVIPDTLPTLEPRADVQIKFPFSTGVNKWVEPGEVVSTNVTSMEPAIKIQEFDHSLDAEQQLYTILIVNPDVPDLEANTYSTSLCFGLQNIKIAYNDNLVDPRRYGPENVLASYLPPVPEKNAGTQRFAVWVFRQPGPLPAGDALSREHFDIRAFTALHGLDAVGAHVWRSAWDSNTAAVRELYRLPPGRVFHRVRANL
ncbi:AGR361Wp [Eremothecium gossypii ATCC 10895]|uniref:Large ribosomal subunit protein mL38 n=1 Tax=Eremothecium gossypii (strain ATCC 10895 / CBS 109.51 / FGSC 9923 / NRRL Y-1056) TaxID=284811 RepID=Q74Z45_EREGS|nr:mitochondrial 54S ribosomal protein YmL35 [Eremothecium gossypii ATCC 10895]AAS54851.1 AGR361Wp [Eremothecium gossypii ATCC 10895]AEY99183.1 FAGR361Wp [Eremothecium gossypii FDAG1]